MAYGLAGFEYAVRVVLKRVNIRKSGPRLSVLGAPESKLCILYYLAEDDVDTVQQQQLVTIQHNIALDVSTLVVSSR